MTYAGIGSRETPDDVLDQMYTLGILFATLGFVLRSGGAEGADETFEAGADLVDGKKEIFLPWRGFRDREDGILLTGSIERQAEKIAQTYHPAWERLSRGGRALQTRNTPQVLGPTLDTPSDFIVCWTRDGKASGGTGQAIRIAEAYGVPVYNLRNQVDLESIEALFE